MEEEQIESNEEAGVGGIVGEGVAEDIVGVGRNIVGGEEGGIV